MLGDLQQHSESSFSLIFDGGEISITVTSSGAEVDDWIAEVLRVHSRRLHHLVVGLDVEWRPSYSRQQNPVAVLQLCVGRRCLVLQILQNDFIPDSLFAFVADPRFTFVGVGIEEDAEKIIDEIGLNVRNMVDLRAMASEKMGRPELRQTGLAGLALVVMGIEVSKPKRVTMSRWDQCYLTYDQISYACVDAFLSFEIGRRLIDGQI